MCISAEREREGGREGEREREGGKGREGERERESMHTYVNQPVEVCQTASVTSQQHCPVLGLVSSAYSFQECCTL